MKNNNYAAFTLIELLLYMSIMVVVITSIAVFYRNSLMNNARNMVISEVTEQGNFILDVITQSIQNADSIIVPSVGVNNSVLTMIVPNVTSSPTSFTFSNNAILKIEPSQSPVNIHSSKVLVEDIVFSNVSRTASSNTIRIELLLRYNSTNSMPEFNHSQTFYTSVSTRR